MILEGVDFSSTNDADWDRLASALKANDKAFVGRYAVNDHSPNGRGISADEYAAYVRHGLGVFLYWESTEGWMLGGYAAGTVAAANAQQNILAAGMPANSPVHFACDFDATPEQQAAIDDTLRGCSAVVGLERTKIYGGYWVVKRCIENGTASGGCQTSAWSGGQVYEGASLYQYAYNAFIDNTNCDLVRAFVPNYGQAGYVDPTPQPKPKPETVYPKADLPDWWAGSLTQSHPSDADVEIDGQTVRMHAVRRRVQAIGNTFRYTKPDIKSPRSGDPIKVKDKVNIERVFDLKGKDANGKTVTKTWFITDTGDYVFAGKFDPKVTVRTR